MGIVETVLITFLLASFITGMWVGLVEMLYGAIVEDNDRWLVVDLWKLLRK